MTREKLEQYCKDRGIFVPPGATREYLCAAIVRAYGHENSMHIHFAKSCFGAWEEDDSSCRVCDFADQCFQTSIGMSKEEYFKKLERTENPKPRFQKMRKK